MESTPSPPATPVVIAPPTLRKIQPSPEKTLVQAVVQICPLKRAASSDLGAGMTVRRQLFSVVQALVQPPLGRLVDVPIPRHDNSETPEPTRSYGTEKNGPEDGIEWNKEEESEAEGRVTHAAVYESFLLIENGVVRLPRSQEELQWIAQAFPTAIAIGVFPPMLVLRFKTLPPKPWPVAVAGLPTFFTTDDQTMGFPWGRPGGSVRALEDRDAREGTSRQMFEEAIQYFEVHLQVALESILNLAGPWIITVPDGVALARLPGVLAKTACTYRFLSDEAKEPLEAALRHTEPTGTVWDTTKYKTLRPGVMLSSNPGLTAELLTTCGIEVEDQAGSRYITLASHGFPFGQDRIHHPNPQGTLLGTVHARLGHSDIALMKFPANIPFENETFGAITADGTRLDGVPIAGVRDPYTMRNCDPISMNNPFSGYRDGLHVGVEMKKVPSDEAVYPHDWVTNQWLYVGNDGVGPTEGSCGSAVLDENGRVISFFRFVARAQPGFAVGVAATTLSPFGYRVRPLVNGHSLV